MAFTYCTNCGEKIDDSEVRCPHCGHIRGQERSYNYGQEQYRGQNNPNSYNQNGYNQNGYNPNGQYQPPQPPQKRPLNIGVVVISILNIVFGCCGIPMIFGIIGLVLAFSAQNLASDKEAEDKNKLALVINIIGLVLMAVSIVSTFMLVALGVFDSLGLALVGSVFF